MTKQYKITANGITEIVEADAVEFMPQTGQTIYKVDGEIKHIAPASALVTTFIENKFIDVDQLFSDIEDVFLDFKSRTISTEVVFEIEEKIQLIQLKYIAENENH